MIQALGDWAVVKFDKPENEITTEFGFVIPSARQQRLATKGKNKVIGKDPDVELPDLVRAGELVSGDVPGAPVGSTVIFNKHDAVGFNLGDYAAANKNEVYYAIQTKLIIAKLDL